MTNFAFQIKQLAMAHRSDKTDRRIFIFKRKMAKLLNSIMMLELELRRPMIMAFGKEHIIIKNIN